MENEIVVGTGGITFAGPDAVALYRAVALRSALKMLQVGLKPTRSLTWKRAFALTKEYTGHDYKRADVQTAVNDLTVWIETMRSALPVREGS